MKLARILAGVGIFALAAEPGIAQRRDSAARAAAAPAPPLVVVQTQTARRLFAGPRPAPQISASRFALENAPPEAFRIPGLYAARVSRVPRIFRHEFAFRTEPFRHFPHFPRFFFGGVGQPICSPLLPGYFGSYWFDRQFSCFGVPFFGVDYYPRSFFAPELAYAPWLRSLAMAREEQMYPSATGGLTAGALDTIAAIAARESPKPDPGQQVTMLALKEGFLFGLTDYWVEDGKLHYVTTYGRENSIDLDRIDLEKTVKVNSARGVPFVLPEKPGPPQ